MRNRRRLSDGGYLLRENIALTTGTGTQAVAVNAGADQNLASGTTQAIAQSAYRQAVQPLRAACRIGLGIGLQLGLALEVAFQERRQYAASGQSATLMNFDDVLRTGFGQGTLAQARRPHG